MKKALLLTGVPGTGKTTIARKLIDDEGGIGAFTNKEPVQLVNAHHKESTDFWIIGKYDNDEVFAGTDKLSMAVSPKFQEFVSSKKPQRLFIEGDRLVSGSTIDFLESEGYNVELYVLNVPKDKLQERYEERGSNQNEQFINSKYTKVSNISNRMDMIFEDRIKNFNHLTPTDTQIIVNEIRGFLEL